MKKPVTFLVFCMIAAAFLLQPVLAQESDKPEPVVKDVEETAVAETAPEKPTEKFQIEKFACGTAVEERELQGEAAAFPSTIERIYCWCLITGCEDTTTIEHVWYYGEQEKARVVLDILYPRVRTWSYKTMLPEWAGDWRVELVDADGKVLATTEFKFE